MKKIVTIAIAIFISIMVITAFSRFARADATIWTDKTDYSPEETVIISGSGFLQYATITGTVIRPTTPETVDAWANVSDSAGNFVIEYKLDGITGIYTVTATDGTNTATPITFTDTPALTIYGNDTATHLTLGAEENLNSVSKGTDLSKTISIRGTGLGTGTITWAISCDAAHEDGSTLAPLTSFNPSTATIKANGVPGANTTVLDIATSTLMVGTTYHGILNATDGTGANNGTYYFNFTVTAPPFTSFKVSGYKNDTSGNALSGWTINLYKENAFVTSTTTAVSTGYYSFTITEAGSYSVNETLKKGWTMITPTLVVGDASVDKIVNGYSFTAVSGQDVPGKNFTNFQWLTVSGVKKDTSGNLLSGWSIKLYNTSDNSLYASTTTASVTGAYSFTVKDPGSYALKEVLNPGWTATSPTYEVGDAINTMEVEGYSFSVVSGQNVPNEDFVNFEWLTISGVKEDTEGNLLSGWTIKLYNSTDDSLVSSTTTALTTGYYEFTVKSPGTYYINEVLPTGWTATDPVYQVGPNTGTVEVTGYSGITVVSDTDIPDKDFVNFEWLTVSGVKKDTEGNGLEGWTIELYNSTGLYASTTTAASTGAYSFTVKDPGTYAIKEVLQDKWTETSPVLTYSAGDGSTPSVLGYSGITVVSGTDVSGKDFTNFEWVTVSGTKTDTSGNGLSDWTIELYNTTDNTLYHDATTADDGSYSITVKDPGTYYLVEVLPTGWTATTPVYQVGPNSGTVEVTGYSDITVVSGTDVTGKDFVNFEWLTVSGVKKDTSGNSLSGWTIKLYNTTTNVYASTTTASVTGAYSFTVKDPGTYSIKEVLQDKWTETSPELQYSPGDGSTTPSVLGYSGITVSSGTDVTGKDFYNFKWVTISGHKYKTGTSTGLSGWTMELYNDEDDSLYASNTTVSGGAYSFTVKDPGDYYIDEVLQAGWTATSPHYQVGNPSTTMEVTGYSFTVSSGTDVIGNNFYNFKWLRISGYKYETGTDNPIEGFTFKLYRGSSLTAYATATSDVEGYYSFTVKDPGTYKINEVLPTGWTLTYPVTAYTVGPASGSVEVTGYSGITVVSGTNVDGKNFENFQWLTISGHKYVTGTTTGLSGWTIKLYNSSDDSLYASTTTAGDGTYSFTVQDPGTYYLVEVLPTGWTLTDPVYQVGPASGTTEVTGYTDITVTSGTDVTGNDFYNFEWLTVSGTKFFDANGNDAKDSGEPGLQNWVIKLYNASDNSLYGSTTTASDGSYSFTVKDPGTYNIKEILKTPWIETTPILTGPFATSQEVLGYSGITVVSGTDVTDQNFGNWLGSSSYVTDSSLCSFDVNSTQTERQFKLIFTPDVPNNPLLYKLTASNPGQFYYNVFYVGSLSAGAKFTITLPYPFVTQGAVPVHVYSSLNTGPYGCLVPGTDISSQFTITITNGYPNVQSTTITVSSKGTYSGPFVYINVHMDYGLKQNLGGLNKIGNNAIGTSVSIIDETQYIFSVLGPGSFTASDTVCNDNSFKRDPGFGGLVLDSTGTPIAGVTVTVKDSTGKVIGTSITDQDGWYMINYKYAGKATTFTITATLNGKTKTTTVTIKSNSFTVNNFQF